MSTLSQICFFWIQIREKEIHYLARIKREGKKSMRHSETGNGEPVELGERNETTFAMTTEQLLPYCNSKTNNKYSVNG